MTTQHDPSGIHALDELGRRFEIATARRRESASRPRRALVVAAAGLVALTATPALAAISGVSIGGVFNSHSSIEEALPQAAALIDPADPVATGKALRRRGIAVKWSFVEDNPGGTSPTKARDVSAPPSGTQILSVLSADGSAKVTEDTQALLIEIAPTDSAILRSHR